MLNFNILSQMLSIVSHEFNDPFTPFRSKYPKITHGTSFLRTFLA